MGTLAAISFTVIWAAKHRIDRIYDAELVAGAGVLYNVLKEQLEHRAELHKSAPPGSALLEQEDVETFNLYANWRFFRIWRDLKLTDTSTNGPVGIAVPRASGFLEFDDGTQSWRVYRLIVPEFNVAIVVGEPFSVRHALIAKFAVALLAPLSLFMLIAAGLTWLALQNGLGALQRLAVALGSKSGQDLSPLNMRDWPSDLAGIVTATNEFLTRLDRSFRQTVRFTDHAAHELRTPLAGLKLNAALMEQEKDVIQQRAIAQRVKEGAERAAALVEQLLSLARLDAGAFSTTSADLAAIAKSALEEFAATAALRSVHFVFRSDTSVAVRGDATVLAMIVRNLVDNAIKYSPNGVDVEIEVSSTDDDGVHLVVTDGGPGIPADERDRVTERFYRTNDSKPGVGLGLSIVAEALARVGGALKLETAKGGTGLTATARFEKG